MEGLGPIRFDSVSMVTATPGANDPKVGDVFDTGDEKYVYVYNAGGSTIAVGHGAILSAVTGYSVTVSSTVSLMAGGVGVCKHTAIPTAEYGYLMTRGFCSYEAGANVALGEALSLAADGVWVNSSGITGNVYGKAMVATDSGGSASAYFNFGF